MNIDRIPDNIFIDTEEQNVDAVVRTVERDGKYRIYIKAEKSHPKYIKLVWNTSFSEDALFLGDAWERTYGDSEWKTLDSERTMPWYFLCEEGETVTAAGVTVQPSSFVGWQASENGIIAEIDVRCGGVGVELDGRELLACEIVTRTYKCSAFDALCDFCSVMCPKPLLPKKPIYGGNNWYYAYGKSSREDILNDTALQAELSAGLENRPYMVIDAGWEQTVHSAPWIPNERFGDMAEIASAIKEMNVHPGIWIRLLTDDRKTTPDEWRNKHCKDGGEGHLQPLDPSHPDVVEHVKETVRLLVGWGYELIKHDFSTFDMFGDWCGGKEYVTDEGWHFYDRKRTSAEIVKDFYKTILDEAGNALVLGCNTVSHLSAGLVHMSRIGDDTSGYEWERTLKYGVNTLAFRLAQHNRFYAADADCVGIIPGKISWEKNSQWTKLLSRSGTPLFISCAKGTLNAEETAEMKDAYRYAAVQTDILKPLDWKENKTPEHWDLSTGENLDFKW